MKRVVLKEKAEIHLRALVPVFLTMLAYEYPMIYRLSSPATFDDYPSLIIGIFDFYIDDRESLEYMAYCMFMAKNGKSTLLDDVYNTYFRGALCNE